MNVSTKTLSKSHQSNPFKMNKKHLIVVIFLTLIACNDKKPKKEAPQRVARKEIVTSEQENQGNSINYDTTKVLETLYVIDRNGTNIKDKADNDSKTLGAYPYGAKLAVIEINEDWLGVMDRITREYKDKNGTEISSNGWEKIYVSRKSVGLLSEIQLIQSDLNIISSSTIKNKTDLFEKEKRLTDYLKIDLIDQKTFENKKNSSVNFLVADTNEIKKTKGIIELKCTNKIKRLIDKPNAEENRVEYEYIGQINFLNKYLVQGSYYESSDYNFFDKTTGELSQSFGEYPVISPDQKNIICIYANPYEDTGDLELYAINNGKIDQILGVSFNHWMPGKDIFWGSDNYLYLTATPTASFWREDGNLNDKFQYLRIKLLH